jgi:hypothetical protein
VVFSFLFITYVGPFTYSQIIIHPIAWVRSLQLQDGADAKEEAQAGNDDDDDDDKVSEEEEDEDEAELGDAKERKDAEASFDSKDSDGD